MQSLRILFLVSSPLFCLLFVWRWIFIDKIFSSKCAVSRIPMKIDGLKSFTFEEMAHATNDFSNSAQIGQGGYGKVYKGILADGKVVAIKRAQQGSLQGSKEFFTEIELLSRLHHRNLVALLGYCDEEDEQVYHFSFSHLIQLVPYGSKSSCLFISMVTPCSLVWSSVISNKI